MVHNRQERRQANKAGGYDANRVKQILEIETKKLREEFAQQSHQIVNTTVEMYSIALATVLHDKEGFGKVRLGRTLDNVDKLCGSMVDDYVTMADCRNMLSEELGIQIGPDEKYTRGSEPRGV